jgi:superoxide dismutase, Cu-Zn family
MLRLRAICLGVTAALVLCTQSYALELKVVMNAVDANNGVKAIGSITVLETAFGLVFTPALSGLSPGPHGFHVHENASCAAGEKDGKPAAAIAAGSHLDPQKSGHHGSPSGNGHLGDLPPLVVDAKGNATKAVTAPRLKRISELTGRSLMIHAGGDNHSDTPQPLGGGGARIACGVIEATARGKAPTAK